MKGFSVSFLILLCLAGTLHANEKKVKLQFITGTPVNLESKASVEICQSLPGFSLSIKGDQTLQAILSIHSGQSDIFVSNPPFDASFILKHLKIAIRANDQNLYFDSADAGSSLYINQIAKIVDRPIRIHFNEGFTIEPQGELEHLIKELPVLQETNAEAILLDLLLHIFELGGEELIQEKVIVKNYETKDRPSLPSQIRYTITSIDDYNVYAHMQGIIEKKTFPLHGRAHAHAKKDEPILVTLNGDMTGKGKWNRDNAMINDIEMLYNYTAMFKLGEWDWMMHLTINVRNQTSLK